ncbi:MAG: acyl-CoA dehydrogenase family protein, partial [Planctomycetota bacterium]
MTSTTTSFLQALFEGRLEPERLLPFPAPDAETRETADSVVAMVHEWAADAIDAAAFDREERLPPEVAAGLAELGLFGLTIPEEHGGAGQGQYVYSRSMEAVAFHCASTVTLLGAHLGIGIKGLLLDGTPEQKARYLPRLASGEWTA